MFKKTACYLSLCLLAAPLVALAEDPALAPASALQLTLTQLAVACPALSPRLDASAQLLLQAFYRQNGEQPVWSAEHRLASLQAQLAQVIDDGLDPERYRFTFSPDPEWVRILEFCCPKCGTGRLDRFAISALPD